MHRVLPPLTPLYQLQARQHFWPWTAFDVTRPLEKRPATRSSNLYQSPGPWQPRMNALIGRGVSMKIAEYLTYGWVCVFVGVHGAFTPSCPAIYLALTQTRTIHAGSGFETQA